MSSETIQKVIRVVSGKVSSRERAVLMHHSRAKWFSYLCDAAIHLELPGMPYITQHIHSEHTVHSQCHNSQALCCLCMTTEYVDGCSEIHECKIQKNIQVESMWKINATLIINDNNTPIMNNWLISVSSLFLLSTLFKENSVCFWKTWNIAHM